MVGQSTFQRMLETMKGCRHPVRYVSRNKPRRRMRIPQHYLYGTRRSGDRPRQSRQCAQWLGITTIAQFPLIRAPRAWKRNEDTIQ